MTLTQASSAKVQQSAKSFLSTADKPVTFSILGAFVIVPGLFVLGAAMQGPLPWGGVATFLFFSVFFSIFLAMFIMDSSELLLDETGLSRKIYGRVCMQIPWIGIISIRETFQITKRGEHRIWIEVIPDKRADLALRLRRSIVTSDQIESFDDLIAMLNERVNQYSIRVDVRTKGIWKQRSQLLANWE